MTSWTRRSFLVAAGCGLAACSSSPPNQSPRDRIDSQVDAALAELYQNVPGAADLGAEAHGVLIIPSIRKLGFFASGAYGEGALLIGPAKVDYYSLSTAGIGLTFGATEFNQALFFMNAQALQDFRVADGWELGVDAAVVVQNDGAAAGVTSTQINRPIQRGDLRPEGRDRRREPGRGQVQPHRPLTPAPPAPPPARTRRRPRPQPRALGGGGAPPRQRGQGRSSDIGMYSDRRHSAARSS